MRDKKWHPKDKWNPARINVEKALKLLDLIIKFEWDREGYMPVETSVYGCAKRLRQEVVIGTTIIAHDWDELSKAIDATDDNSKLIIWVDELYDVLRIAELNVDRQRRMREVRDKVDRARV